MVISIVGSGGKTTLIKRMAEEFRHQGKKVFVTTSTHMSIESDTLLTDDADVIIRHIEEYGYAMAGAKDQYKIKELSLQTYKDVCKHADVVLVEADGSKHLPIKFPNSTEPVIYDNTNEIIIVCGLHALGRPAQQVAHRLELVKQCLGIDDDTIITPDHIIKLLREGYVNPFRRQYPHIKLTVYPAQADSPELHSIAQSIITEALAVEPQFSL